MPPGLAAKPKPPPPVEGARAMQMILRYFLSVLTSFALVSQPVLAQAVNAQPPSGAEALPARSPVDASVPEAGAAPSEKAETSETVEPQPLPPVAEEAPYQPQDKDERGLWMQMDEAERELKNSPMVIRDPDLNAYVRGVLCRTVGDGKCAHVRLYLMRTAYFNASMAPNGVMQVWSGLLLRTQNEAQLAAVLGHEYTHYENRHSLQLFRNIKSKSNTAAWLSFTGIGLIASFAMTASIFGFSREMEREADSGGLEKMASAGYDTREAAEIWERLREEMDATAEARNTKSRKDRNGGLFATHPPSAERVRNLTEQSAQIPGIPGETGASRFAEAMAAHWPDFVDDQLKLNDFGASEYLLESLARNGWSEWLLYARGELYRRRAGEGDLKKATGFYGQAIAAGASMPQLWRGRGLALLKLGQADAGKADLAEYIARAPDAPDRNIIAMMAGDQR
jgi:predicted Zn-dependent protease